VTATPGEEERHRLTLEAVADVDAGHLDEHGRGHFP
jgi:hypothetical protein